MGDDVSISSAAHFYGPIAEGGDRRKESGMSSLVVVTDTDTALGFRLAGVDVIEVSTQEEATKQLCRFLNGNEPGIVIYNQEYQTALPEKTRSALEESVSPVFYAIPVVHAEPAGEPREEYLARLLRRAIGYRLKIKR
jgi:V/A-type H+-transporting ATPase subunit F